MARVEHVAQGFGHKHKDTDTDKHPVHKERPEAGHKESGKDW